jgi:hypothetical protein
VMKSGKTDGKTLAASFICAFCVAFDPAAGNAGSNAPLQLFGRSIVVSWSETRMQRTVGEEQFHAQSGSLTERLYISTTGRPFERITHGHSPVLREQMGTGGQTPTGRARALQFQGRSIVIIAGRINGARRVEINFDEHFESCAAQVVNGKEADASVYTVAGIRNPGTLVQVQSVSTSAATCSITDGNVLAD